MTGVGVYGITRTIWDHPVFDEGDKPWLKAQAWAWLIGAAAFKPHKIKTKAGVIELNRGEFCLGLRFLANKWHWPKTRVERFILVLKKQDMIRDASRDGVQVYFICNYNEYQRVALPTGTHTGTQSGTEVGRNRDATGTKKKEGKEGKVPFSEENGARAPATLFEEPPKALPAPSAISSSVVPLDPWKTIYDRGKAVLGPGTGGVITNLKLLYDGKPHKVLAKIEDAAEQREPLKWITAFLWKVDDGGRLSGQYIGGVPP